MAMATGPRVTKQSDDEAAQGAWLGQLPQLHTETQTQHRHTCHTQCFISTDIPGLKKNCGTVQHLITLTGSILGLWGNARVSPAQHRKELDF